MSDEGVVFTKPWVVSFMLNVSGYDPSLDLSSMRVLEPSCGEGAFIVPIVERLCRSMAIHGRGPDDVMDSLLALDLDPLKVDSCRVKVAAVLRRFGWSEEDVESVVSHWIVRGDFLISNISGRFDFVVGNPPYIKASSLDADIREQYVSSLTTFTLGTDIFVGFIERGLRLLNQSGKLCYICADRWMQNSYGRKLRKFILSQYHMDLICRMHEVDAFEDKVDAYPAIVLINGSTDETIYVDCSSTFGPDNVSYLVENIKNNTMCHDDSFEMCHLHALDASGEPWMLSKPHVLEMINDLKTRFPIIEDTGVKIGIGVATGRDEVFITDRVDLVESDRQLPLLCNRDIVDKHPPSMPKHWLVNPWDEDGKLVDLSDYPEMKIYFESNRHLLVNRHIAKKDSNQWYRTIDKVKSDLASVPKLLFSDLSSRSEPIFDQGGYYPHHNLYWLTSDTWDMKVLGGLLLSNQVESIIDAYGVKMRGKTMRFQAQYLRLIHLPNPEDISKVDSDCLRDAFTRRDRVLATQVAENVLLGC